MTVFSPVSAKVIASGRPTCPPPPITQTSRSTFCASLMRCECYTKWNLLSDCRLFWLDESDAKRDSHQCPEDPKRRIANVVKIQTCVTLVKEEIERQLCPDHQHQQIGAHFESRKLVQQLDE